MINIDKCSSVLRSADKCWWELINVYRCWKINIYVCSWTFTNIHQHLWTLINTYQRSPTHINTYHSLSKFINIDQPLKIVAFWNSTSTNLKQTRKQCSSYLVKVFKIINQSIWAILMSIIQSYEYWSCPPLAQKMANKRVKIVTLRQMSSYFRKTETETETENIFARES